MTTSTAVEVERRRGAPRKPRTLAASLGSAFITAAMSLGCSAATDEHAWPSPKYQADPVGFFREALGIEPWEKQIEIAEAVRDHKRVAVKSGHKVSKSHTAAALAAWFFCSFEDARVVMSSTTSRQVDQILWREFRMMVARSKVPICEPDELHELARSGLKASDFREVVGFTAREAEAVAGVSGKNLLYILDEASGIDDAIFEAIEGNRAGGARVAMFSNPTQTIGEFFEAFHAKSRFYRTITISSEETPNVKAGREVISGLATREWVEEKKQEWGVDSALYKIRVKGEFALNEASRIISVHAIGEAEKRWAQAPAEGRLVLGVDPAGESGEGDESMFVPRRGAKVLGLHPKRGLSDEAHVREAIEVIARHRRPRDHKPLVVLDREGPIGKDVYYAFLAHLEKDGHHDDFELVPVRASDAAFRQPDVYDRVRDELFANLAKWLRPIEDGGVGGAIPEDAKLAKELHAPKWDRSDRGRWKATPKKELRKILGRSPDRLDGVALAVWVDTATVAETAPAPPPKPADEPDDDLSPYAAPELNPYGGDL